jgi:hypothetical protein
MVDLPDYDVFMWLSVKKIGATNVQCAILRGATLKACKRRAQGTDDAMTMNEEQLQN